MISNIGKSKGDRIFLFINNFILFIFLIIYLYPLIYVVSSSFSSAEAVMSGKVWLFPIEPTLEGYKAVFNSNQIWGGYLNTIFYAVVGTSINILLTLMAAYPLSRKDFIGKNYIMFFFVFTMFFSGGMIPTYLLVRDLNLIDTRWALLIPNAIAIWYVILTRTYFQSNIPVELLESSQLDGCSNRTFLIKIVLPLSKPIVAVIALFYIVGHWNEYFSAMIYLNDKNLFPLQIILRNILIQNEMDNSMMSNIEFEEARIYLAALLKYSLIIIASFPVLVAYPFVQKYFVKGIMIGALKG